MFLGGGKLNYMEFSIAALLSHLSPDRSIATKVLEKKLGCESPNSIEQLELALGLLEKVGIITKDRGKYRREPLEETIEAKLRCSSKGFCFAIQDIEGIEDIYIRETNLSNAWNGDRVLVETIKEGTRRRSPEGAVKLILERANSTILAKVKRAESGGYRAVPLDDRLLVELDLGDDLSEYGDNIEDALVKVELKRHAIAKELPIGKVLSVLGTSAESATELDIVSCKHDLRSTFTDDVIEEASKIDTKKLPKSLAEVRVDLRDVTTIAIARDNQPLETAISTIEHEGNLRAIVHIADVAGFIAADERIDREAKKRVSSIYLQDATIPLFPPAAIAACELTPGADRLAFSIALDLNANGELVEFSIQPSLIRVDRSIAVSDVEAVLNGTQSDLPAEIVAIVDAIWNRIAPIFRSHRHQRGGLDVRLFAAPTPLADEGRLGALFVDDPTALLAEVMVMVNYAIASHLQALQVPGIYAIQHRPDLVEIKDAIDLAVNLGLQFDRDAETEIGASDLQKLADKFSEAPVPKVLNYLFKSLLKTTIYSTSPSTHFGLAIENGYTHCVSPLSRYSDLLIQRVLHEVFAGGRDRKSSRSKEGINLGSSTCHGQISWNVLTPAVQQELETQISGIISHLNDRVKIAQEAENDYVGLQKADRMRARTGEIFQGLITGVQSYGFFVEIEDSLVEGLVHVSSLKDDWYEFRPRYACLVGRKNRTSYRLGDRVEVQVKSVDYYRQQIDLVTVASINNTEVASNNDDENLPIDNDVEEFAIAPIDDDDEFSSNDDDFDDFIDE